jgi:hypothetical protein
MNDLNLDGKSTATSTSVGLIYQIIDKKDRRSEVSHRMLDLMRQEITRRAASGSSYEPNKDFNNLVLDCMESFLEMLQEQQDKNLTSAKESLERNEQNQELDENKKRYSSPRKEQYVGKECLKDFLFKAWRLEHYTARASIEAPTLQRELMTILSTVVIAEQSHSSQQEVVFNNRGKELKLDHAISPNHAKSILRNVELLKNKFLFNR